MTEPKQFGPMHYSPAMLDRHRIQLSRGRAISGEDISGLAISGRCRVVLTSGEVIFGFDFGTSNGARRIVRQGDGLVFAFGPGWIKSVDYFYEPRDPFGGHHLAALRRLLARST